ncbi:unnamed protein product, partial [Didymodactylos carnosus]
PNIEHTEKINATFLTVWKLMLDKIEHPSNYTPGVSNIVLVENTSEYIIREMTLGDLGSIRERITWDDDDSPGIGKVTYILEKHPKYKGEVVNWVRRAKDDPKQTELEYQIRWEPLDGHSEADQEQLFRQQLAQAVQIVKRIAEHMAGTNPITPPAGQGQK